MREEGKGEKNLHECSSTGFWNKKTNSELSVIDIKGYKHGQGKFWENWTLSSVIGEWVWMVKPKLAEEERLYHGDLVPKTRFCFSYWFYIESVGDAACPNVFMLHILEYIKWTKNNTGNFIYKATLQKVVTISLMKTLIVQAYFLYVFSLI